MLREQLAAQQAGMAADLDDGGALDGLIRWSTSP